MIKIKLDGIWVPPSQVSDVSVEVRRAYDNRSAFTTTLEFSGDMYQHIFDELVLSPFGNTRTLPVEIWDFCCSTDGTLVFTGKVRGDSISFCSTDCTLSIEFYEESARSRAYKCLNETLISESDISTMAHPQVPYCTQFNPNWMHHMIVLIAIAMQVYFVYLTVMRVITVFNLASSYAELTTTASGVAPYVSAALIAIANIKLVELLIEIAILTGLLITLALIQAYVPDFVVDCGRIHPSPYVRTYAEKICEKCGITFNSSIFGESTSPYYNTVYFSAATKRGNAGASVGVIADNAPIDFADKWFDNISAITNARWRIVDGVLILERWDYFYDIATPLPFPDGAVVCYTALEEPMKSNALVQFEEDGLDTTGNEAKFPWYYDRIDWNPLAIPGLMGTAEYSHVFGMHRERNDGLEQDVISFWQLLLDLNYPTNKGGEYKDRTLMMERGYCMYPKLLVVDNRGRIVGRNAPFHATALYDNFYSIDNPALTAKRFTAEVTTGALDCDGFALYSSSLGSCFDFPYGRMLVEELSVNYSDRTIKFNGTLVQLT